MSWFSRFVSSTEELEYGDLLTCYGLRFAASEEPQRTWQLEIRPDQTEAQRRNLRAWLQPSS